MSKQDSNYVLASQKRDALMEKLNQALRVLGTDQEAILASSKVKVERSLAQELLKEAIENKKTAKIQKLKEDISAWVESFISTERAIKDAIKKTNEQLDNMYKEQFEALDKIVKNFEAVSAETQEASESLLGNTPETPEPPAQ